MKEFYMCRLPFTVYRLPQVLFLSSKQLPWYFYLSSEKVQEYQSLNDRYIGFWSETSFPRIIFIEISILISLYSNSFIVSNAEKNSL